MALDTNTLAVIRSLNERVGEAVSYPYLKDEYRWRGGDPKKLGDTLERVVRMWPGSVEWENRLGHQRRIETWVRVVEKINEKIV